MKIANNLIESVEAQNWDEWLKEINTILKDKGYTKGHTINNGEAFSYSKTFYVENNKAYVIILYFFDWRYMPDFNIPISTQYETYILSNDAHFRMSISADDMSLITYEEKAKQFFEMLKEYHNPE